MYEYLIGCLILGVIWASAFVIRRDLRKPMLWSGVAYIVLMTAIYITLKVITLFIYIGPPLVPAYWNPNTLFDLSTKTGGYAVEDVLFMFFAGGIVTFVYEFFFRRRIKFKKTHKHHVRAPLIGAFAAIVFALVFRTNPIYPLIIFGFLGAATMWVERPDLLKHSLFGGFLFLSVYFLAFLLFNSIFPDFVHRIYNLQNISGILFSGVPFEELLFAAGFGFLWAPIYEYEHGEKNIAG